MPEPPHVSIILKKSTWRWGLREQAFWDGEPPPRGVPAELVSLLKENLDTLVGEWDAMYPLNKVTTGDEK